MLNKIEAHEGKVWAYKEKDGREIVMGRVIYLGSNDNGIGYYEIDEQVEETPAYQQE